MDFGKGSQKTVTFLNVEFFIHEESQYHDIKISCCNIDINIVTKKACTYQCICAALLIRWPIDWLHHKSMHLLAVFSSPPHITSVQELGMDLKKKILQVSKLKSLHKEH